MISNATKEELQQSLELVNRIYEGNIIFKNISPVGRRLRFTLTVKDSHKKGGRLSQSQFHPGRHICAACWHVHGNFFDALFSIRENIYIYSQGRKITAMAGNWHDKNIGSMMYPVNFSEACECTENQISHSTVKQFTETI